MTAMTLRVARQRNVLLAFVAASMVASLFLLSQTHSRLRRVQEDADKCHQKHDSLAAQLTVLYEHKARLEKTLEAEIERKKLVDDELKTMQAALLKEKVSQKEKYSKLLRDYDEHKTQQAAELSKLKATFESLRGDKEKLDAEVDELNIQAEKLRDTNHKLEEEVRKMQQSQPIDMNEVARLRERVQQCDAGGDFSGTHTSSLSSSTSASVHQGAAPAAAGIESAVPAELNNQPVLPAPVRAAAVGLNNHHQTPSSVSPASTLLIASSPGFSASSTVRRQGHLPAPMASRSSQAHVLAQSRYSDSGREMAVALDKKSSSFGRESVLHNAVDHPQRMQGIQRRASLLRKSPHNSKSYGLLNEQWLLKSSLGHLNKLSAAVMPFSMSQVRRFGPLGVQTEVPGTAVGALSRGHLQFAHDGSLAAKLWALHDSQSRFYALPDNRVNLEQLRSKHGILTFY